MPRTKREKVKRVPIRLPKPMTNEVDRIVEEHKEYGWTRQRFIENAVAEMIMKVKSMMLLEKREGKSEPTKR